MRKILPAFAALLFVLVSCQQPDQTIKIDNKYSLMLPAFLEKATDLHKEASLQYQNLRKEFYVIVIDESKAEFNKAIQGAEALGYSANLDGYAKLGINFMKETATFDGEPVAKPTTINALPARILDITGTIDKIPVYWKEAYVEGKNTYYQVIVWTLLDKKAEHQKKMEEVVRSFKEYDKGRK